MLRPSKRTCPHPRRRTLSIPQISKKLLRKPPKRAPRQRRRAQLMDWKTAHSWKSSPARNTTADHFRPKIRLLIELFSKSSSSLLPSALWKNSRPAASSGTASRHRRPTSRIGRGRGSRDSRRGPLLLVLGRACPPVASAVHPPFLSLATRKAASLRPGAKPASSNASRR